MGELARAPGPGAAKPAQPALVSIIKFCTNYVTFMFDFALSMQSIFQLCIFLCKYGTRHPNYVFTM
jgi:hypothetical protein